MCALGSEAESRAVWWTVSARLHAMRAVVPTGELMLCPEKEVTEPGTEAADPPAGALRSLVISVILVELICSRQTFLPLCSCVIPSLYLLSLAESLVIGLRS